VIVVIACHVCIPRGIGNGGLTAAEIENGIPRSANVNTPPAIASGTAVKTVMASTALPKA
jgi:hypothetical protein